MIRVRYPAGLLALIVILLSAPALAHRLDVVVKIEDDLLVVEALYGENLPVKNAKVDVSTNPPTANGVDDAISSRGETDAQGRYVFRPSSLASLTIAVNDGHGHRRELEVPAAKLKPLFEASPQATIGTSGPKTTVLVDTREESSIDGWPTWLKMLTAFLSIFVTLAVLAQIVSRGAKKR